MHKKVYEVVKEAFRGLTNFTSQNNLHSFSGHVYTIGWSQEIDF